MINSMRRIVLSCVFVATAFTLGAQRTEAMGVQAQASLSIEQVKDELYAIIGSGGNVGVRVTSEGVILIDDKFPQNFAEIQELVGTVSDQPVRYVLNNASSWRPLRWQCGVHQHRRDHCSPERQRQHGERQPGCTAKGGFYRSDRRLSGWRGGPSFLHGPWAHER